MIGLLEVEKETSLLLPLRRESGDSSKGSSCNGVVVLVVALLGLISGSFYIHAASIRTDSPNYRQSPSPLPVEPLFHADIDTDTGLTGIYGVDSGGNYRLFARGEYLFNVSGSQWNYLNIENIPTDNDDDYISSMRAVGYLEGRLTCVHMQEYYLNFMHDMFEGHYPPTETQNFLRRNYEWVTEKANERYSTDDYWLSVKVLLAQMEGMLHGLKESCPCEGAVCSDKLNLQSLDNPHMIHILLLNADGDLYQITEKYTQVARRRRLRKVRMMEALRRRLSAKDPNIEGDDGPSADPLNPLDRSGKDYDSHCSAFIKLLPNNSDIIIGHDTWDSFESASPRSIKRLRLHTFTRSQVVVPHWEEPIVGSLRSMSNVGPHKITEATKESRWGHGEHTVSDVTFSSSPGFLASIDDFYVTSGGYGNLMVTETSLDLYAPPLVNQIHPESVLCYMRTIVANSLSRSGAEWSWWFSVYHSGTYVNQWMIIDMKKFTPYEHNLKLGLLTVLEEMPGLVHSEDQTEHLQNTTYWASFNLPFYPDIFKYSGASNLCRTNPGLNCYNSDPRSELFKAHQANVTDMESFMQLMTSNNYETDPLSRGDPCNAISCRQDLEANPWIRDPFGAIDSKVSTVNSCTGRWGDSQNQKHIRMLKDYDNQEYSENSDGERIPPSRNVVWARNGPTYDTQPTFCWSTFYGGYGVWKETEADFSHAGHPDCFHFPWQAFPPTRYA